MVKVADSGVKTELAGKVYVLETCSETDSGVLFRVSGSDFETNSKLSSGARADTTVAALSGAGADSVIAEKNYIFLWNSTLCSELRKNSL